MDKVLIVEDNEVIARLWDMTLREAGFGVALAETGQQALDKIRSENPDLILLDLVMPDLDGFEIFEKILEDPVHCHIPVIFLTNYSERADITRALAMGAADFIVKANILPEELVEKIRASIDRVREKRGA
ncbi:MAG: response regulator [Armatimonadetes bacterium]|nr:response regulator [Armatimonadota bacterium]